MSDIIVQGNPFQSPICNKCIHKIIGKLSCKAFDVIPVDIYFENNDHSKVFPGQKGILFFTPKKKVDVPR